jgi:hypothetical protein
MTSLTLSIDERLLHAARLRAVREGTSVNEICRRALQAYAQPAGQSQAARYLQLLSEIDAGAAPADGMPPASASQREAEYARVLAQRHPTLMRPRKKAGQPG